MTPRIDEVDKPTVGKFYMVPARKCIKGRPGFNIGTMVPTLGGLHEDADLGVAVHHWHIDWRFIAPGIVRDMVAWRYRSGRPHREAVTSRIMGIIMTPEYLSEEEEWIRRKMQRPHPTFPEWENGRKLERKYAGAVAKCLICPHRGMPLAGAPVRGGALVCPGHGLAFDRDTLVLKPRPA